MAEAPRRRMTTRTKNAEQHPGQLILENSRKRRTKAQIASDKEKIAAREEEELEALQSVIQRVATLERSITHEDDNEATPRPRPKPKSRTNALSRTRGYEMIPLVSDRSNHNTDNDETGGDGTEDDDYRPESASDVVSQTDDGHDTDTSEEQPPKKKQRKGMSAVRAEIKTINKEHASGGNITTAAATPTSACVLRNRSNITLILTTFSQPFERKQETRQFTSQSISKWRKIGCSLQGKRPTLQPCLFQVHWHHHRPKTPNYLVVRVGFI
jgi:hypothetical protein